MVKEEDDGADRSKKLKAGRHKFDDDSVTMNKMDAMMAAITELAAVKTQTILMLRDHVLLL